MICVVGWECVTQLHDVVYIVCSSCCGSASLWRFNTTTRQQLPAIYLPMRAVTDIAACELTSQLYLSYIKVIDHKYDSHRVCRVSEDGSDVRDLLTLTISSNRFFSLSVTSGRILVTSTERLFQLDSGGHEMRRVPLPKDMDTCHAVESPNETFMVNHRLRVVKELFESQWQIIEVNTTGEVLRHFTGSRLLPVGYGEHIGVDSHGNILVADYNCILLLDAQLALRRVIVDEHQLNGRQPNHVSYAEESGQLFVSLDRIMDNIAVFDVLRH